MAFISAKTKSGRIATRILISSKRKPTNDDKQEGNKLNLENKVSRKKTVNNIELGDGNTLNSSRKSAISDKTVMKSKEKWKIIGKKEEVEIVKKSSKNINKALSENNVRRTRHNGQLKTAKDPSEVSKNKEKSQTPKESSKKANTEKEQSKTVKANEKASKTNGKLSISKVTVKKVITESPKKRNSKESAKTKKKELSKIKNKIAKKPLKKPSHRKKEMKVIKETEKLSDEGDSVIEEIVEKPPKRRNVREKLANLNENEKENVKSNEIINGKGDKNRKRTGNGKEAPEVATEKKIGVLNVVIKNREETQKPKKNGQSAKTPLKEKLRKRITKNYEESPLENSKTEEIQKLTHKLPIYKQQIEEKPTKTVDLYEFDSDTEKEKKKKKPRKSTDEEFKLKAKKRKRIRKIIEKQKTVNKSGEEYNETINNIMKNVMTKINNKKSEKDLNKLITNNRKNLNISEIDKKIPDNENNNNNKIINESNKETNPPENSNAKIQIISDIRLDHNEISVNSPILKPNANSTMIIRKKAKKATGSPWRFNDDTIIRNPHFLLLKRSGLPNLSQEMVLDHSLIERFNESTMESRIEDATKTSRQSEDGAETAKEVAECEDVKTPKRQTTLLEFYGNSEQQINKENLDVSTLFDDHHFSPIKASHKRILLNRNDENILSSTPLQNEQIEQSYFGFERFDEIESNENVKKPYRFSVTFKKYKKKNKREINTSPENVTTPAKKCRNEENLQVLDEEEKEIGNEKLSENKEDSEENSEEIRLFEDVEPIGVTVKKIYKKKQKWMKFVTNEPDEEEKATKKKRRDVRTKSEEEEAEKWAEAFNSMCKEVEDFPLEIE